jgi:hypothetical protein
MRWIGGDSQQKRPQETRSLGSDKPWLLGVMHGFYPALPRELISIETGSTALFAENSGIAIVFPSWRLVEILEHEDVKKRIDEISSLDEKST